MNTTKGVRFAFAVVTVFTLAACNISVNRVATSSLRTFPVNVPMATDRTKAWDIEIDPGAASIVVTSDGTALISGTVSYNVDDWKPTLAINDLAVTLRQNQFSGISPLNAQNDWRLRLGPGVPMSLTVKAGATKGDWELGGLSLRSLDWHQGASDTTLRFSQPNPEPIGDVNIDAGASTMKLQGLANLNVQNMKVDVSAGTILLRFDGRLTRDLEVVLTGGAAAVTVDSGGNPVKVIQKKSLTAVTRGAWQKDGDSYLSTEWDGTTVHNITVNVSLGAATLDLVSGR